MTREQAIKAIENASGVYVYVPSLFHYIKLDKEQVLRELRFSIYDGHTTPIDISDYGHGSVKIGRREYA